jgi:hypothetical protein
MLSGAFLICGFAHPGTQDAKKFVVKVLAEQGRNRGA